MPDIIIKNSIAARNPRGTRPNDNAFHSFSVKPYSPTDKGIKVGKAGRRLIASDKRSEEDITSREKYRNNYDRIFGKRSER